MSSAGLWTHTGTDPPQAHLTGARCVETVLLEGRNHFLPWNSADVVRASVQQALEGGC